MNGSIFICLKILGSIVIWNRWIYREVFYLWFGFVFLSVLIFNLLCSKIGKRRERWAGGSYAHQEEDGIVPCKKYPWFVWTTWGKEYMLPLHLAYGTLMKLHIMYRNVQTYWSIMEWRSEDGPLSTPLTLLIQTTTKNKWQKSPTNISDWACDVIICSGYSVV